MNIFVFCDYCFNHGHIISIVLQIFARRFIIYLQFTARKIELFHSVIAQNPIKLRLLVVFVDKESLPLLVPLRNDTLAQGLFIHGDLVMQRVIHYFPFIHFLKRGQPVQKVKGLVRLSHVMQVRRNAF